MAEWYSRADRERMAQGLDPLPRSTLTIEDYKDILGLAMQEARDGCRAQGLIGDVAVKDMGNVHAGLTSSNRDLDGKLTGRYDVSVDWSEKFRNNLADPGTGTARFAQRLTAVYHEFRHVEQHGMVHGDMPIKTKEDMEVATQMVVNSMYPSLYSRGYENTISEVDADVYGIQGALAFVDRHPELKERYGFDFRKEIMRTDEYDVLPDETQLKSRSEDLLSGMMRYRRHVYSDPWVEVSEGRQVNVVKPGSTEDVFLSHLQEKKGISMADLEGMTNDDRNVLLLENAMEVINDPAYRGKVASNIRALASNPVLQDRYDVALQNYNDAYSAAMDSQGDRLMDKADLPVFNIDDYVRSRAEASTASPTSTYAVRTREIQSRWGDLTGARVAENDLGLDIG